MKRMAEVESRFCVPDERVSSEKKEETPDFMEETPTRQINKRQFVFWRRLEFSFGEVEDSRRKCRESGICPRVAHNPADGGE
jgi:hypothetical protein